MHNDRYFEQRERAFYAHEQQMRRLRFARNLAYCSALVCWILYAASRILWG